VNNVSSLNEKTELTVLIVTYNSQHSLGKTLDSVAEFTTDVTTEYLIWDNASADQSVNIASKWSRANTKILESKVNLGFAIAMNRLARIANGRYLLFLNPDCVVSSSCVENLLVQLESNKKLGAVGPVLENLNGKSMAGGGWQPPPLRMMSEDIMLPRLLNATSRTGLYALRTSALSASSLYPVSWVAGTCMLVRRDDFLDVGGFSEDLFMYCEDMDLGRRLGLKGLDSALVPNAHALHEGGGSHSTPESGIRLHKVGLWGYYRGHLAPANPLATTLFWILLSTYFIQRQIWARIRSSRAGGKYRIDVP